MIWQAGKERSDWFGWLWYRRDKPKESWWHDPEILGKWPHTKWQFIRIQLEAQK